MTDERYLEYRRKHFAIEIKPARDPDVEGEIAVSMTHNGRQWSTFNLTPEEVVKLIAALSEKRT